MTSNTKSQAHIKKLFVCISSDASSFTLLESDISKQSKDSEYSKFRLKMPGGNESHFFAS